MRHQSLAAPQKKANAEPLFHSFISINKDIS